MAYAVLEKEIEKLDEMQQKTVAQFVRFILSQKASATPVSAQLRGGEQSGWGNSIWDSFLSARTDEIGHIDQEWTTGGIDAEDDAPPKKTRRVSLYGALKGKVGMTADFDAPLEDFAEYMQ